MGIIIAALCFIWLERNARIFEDGMRSMVNSWMGQCVLSRFLLSCHKG